MTVNKTVTNKKPNQITKLLFYTTQNQTKNPSDLKVLNTGLCNCLSLKV
jgi:hypothetical protein